LPRRTSAWVTSMPAAATTKEGAITTRRRSQSGIRNGTKPCTITWPAMTPTPSPRSRSPTTSCRRRAVRNIHGKAREVPPGGDPDLGRERLEQRGNEVGDKRDPEELVALSGAGLNIRHKISRIHIGDRDRRSRRSPPVRQTAALPAGPAAGRETPLGRQGSCVR
jgi:hypothetical protein